MIVSLDEFLVNKLHRYLVARSVMDLFTMLAVSPFTISSLVGHSNLHSSAEAEASLLPCLVAKDARAHTSLKFLIKWSFVAYIVAVRSVQNVGWVRAVRLPLSHVPATLLEHFQFPWLHGAFRMLKS